MIYRRGRVWWFEFYFARQRIRESTKTTSKSLAREAERARRRELEEGFNGIRRRQPRLLSVAAEEWLALKRHTLSPRSVIIERANFCHLLPVLGKCLISDISAADISLYQQRRLSEGASPKTINLEVGTLRAILRKKRLWARLQPDVKMLQVRSNVGRAIALEEENRLMGFCAASRSRSLYPAVVLALNTCLRHSELKHLRWRQIDLTARTVTVGKSKTECGTGRVIPLNERAVAVMTFWAEQFPARQPEHFLFPAERYGGRGDSLAPCAYDTDPTKPIGSWKVAWRTARTRAGVRCRFHDLRHTGCTRMLEAGVPFAVVAAIMGWSTSTTARMVKIYGHIGQAAQREAVAALARIDSRGQYPQLSPQKEERRGLRQTN